MSDAGVPKGYLYGVLLLLEAHWQGQPVSVTDELLGACVLAPLYYSYVRVKIDPRVTC